MYGFKDINEFKAALCRSCNFAPPALGMVYIQLIWTDDNVKGMICSDKRAEVIVIINLLALALFVMNFTSDSIFLT